MLNPLTAHGPFKGLPSAWIKIIKTRSWSLEEEPQRMLDQKKCMENTANNALYVAALVLFWPTAKKQLSHTLDIRPFRSHRCSCQKVNCELFISLRMSS